MMRRTRRSPFRPRRRRRSRSRSARYPTTSSRSGDSLSASYPPPSARAARLAAGPFLRLWRARWSPRSRKVVGSSWTRSTSLPPRLWSVWAACSSPLTAVWCCRSAATARRCRGTRGSGWRHEPSDGCGKGTCPRRSLGHRDLRESESREDLALLVKQGRGIPCRSVEAIVDYLAARKDAATTLLDSADQKPQTRCEL